MNILEYENYQEKILHGDPLFPYITYLCSIPLDFGYVPMHWHDEMEIIYIKKGNGTITVDFTQHTVSAGDKELITGRISFTDFIVRVDAGRNLRIVWTVRGI